MGQSAKGFASDQGRSGESGKRRNGESEWRSVGGNGVSEYPNESSPSHRGSGIPAAGESAVGGIADASRAFGESVKSVARVDANGGVGERATGTGQPGGPLGFIVHTVGAESFPRRQGAFRGFPREKRRERGREKRGKRVAGCTGTGSRFQTRQKKARIRQLETL
jgi:hypothetical protein